MKKEKEHLRNYVDNIPVEWFNQYLQAGPTWATLPATILTSEGSAGYKRFFCGVALTFSDTNLDPTPDPPQLPPILLYASLLYFSHSPRNKGDAYLFLSTPKSRAYSSQPSLFLLGLTAATAQAVLSVARPPFCAGRTRPLPWNLWVFGPVGAILVARSAS